MRKVAPRGALWGVRVRFLLLPAALAAIATFASPPARATGHRHCELVVTDAQGAPLTPSEDGIYDAPEGAELTAVAACVDTISAFPHSSSHDVTPPELRLERVSACRAPNGAEERGPAAPLEPLTDAPELRRALRDPTLRAFVWRGHLPPGVHELTAGSTRRVRVRIAGEPPPVPACPPKPPETPRETYVYVPREPPPEPAPTSEPTPDWDDRRGTVWELGAGPILTKSTGTDLAVGGIGVIGLHRVVRYSRPTPHEKQGELFGSGEWTRWCVPLAVCAGVGLLAMPVGVLVGNELGVDLRGGATSTVARATVRPVLRYARGVLRTTSLLGFLTPEVGAQARLDRPRTDLLVRWSLFPIDVRMSRAFALGIDPFAAGLLVGLSERETGSELGGEITLRLTP